MYMKKIKSILILSIFLACFNLDLSLSAEQQKQQSYGTFGKAKYNFITFDLFGGVMYGYSLDDYKNDMTSAYDIKDTTQSLSLFAGIDFYFGGYFDKMRKRYREYLITPLVGVEFDYNVWNKTKTDIGEISNKDQYSFHTRIGGMFKLKGDINLKIYALLGFANTHIVGIAAKDDDAAHGMVGLRVYDDFLPGIDYSSYYGGKRTAYEFSYGFGIETTIKQVFLLGFEFRTRENSSILNDWTKAEIVTHDEWLLFINQSMRYSMMFKAGFVF